MLGILGQHSRVRPGPARPVRPMAELRGTTQVVVDSTREPVNPVDVWGVFCTIFCTTQSSLGETPMAHVPAAQFRENLSSWLDRAERGDEVIIERHGRPSVRLVAVANQQSQAAAQLEVWRARAVLHDLETPAVDPDEWEMLT